MSFASFLHAHHHELSGDASSAIAAYESLVATSSTHPYDDAQIPTTSEPPAPLLRIGEAGLDVADAVEGGVPAEVGVPLGPDVPDRVSRHTHDAPTQTRCR